MQQQVHLARRDTIPGYAKWLFLGLALLGTYLSPNPLPFALGIGVFIIFVRLLYNPDNPPVLLYCFVFEWVFFQTQLFDGLAKNVDLISLDFYSLSKPFITILGFISIFFFFLGVYLVSRTVPRFSIEDFKSFFARVNLDKLLVVYFMAFVVLIFLGGIIWVIPSLTQPLYVLLEFRSSLFFILFLGAFIQNRYKWMVFAIILVESAVGLFSFFSSFKEIFIFSFLGYWIFFFRSSFLSKTVSILMLILVIYFGVLWTSIKVDYRSFLNKGTGTQTVRVSRGDAYSKLTDLVFNVDGKKLETSFEIFVDRFSWIGAFDAVYNYVPRVRPYEDGNLWLEALQRTFMPRLFFPGKNALTDSKELNYYSGLGVNEKETSISLSVISASYIDFGIYWMHAPMFLFGLLCGWAYRKAFEWGKSAPVGFALAIPLIFTMQITGQSINKLLPHIVLYVMVLWCIHKFLLKSFLRFIQK